VTFLVLGRPRSRTGWVANLLTVPPASHCLHEGLADVAASPSRLRERLRQLPVREAGCADTGLIHHLDGVLATFPDARLVLLTGGEASWRHWCSRTGMHHEVRSRVEADYRRAEERLQGLALRVDCKALTSDISEARRLWAHCLPTDEFSDDRWQMLRDLNVQVIPQSLARRLARSGLQTRQGL